MEREEFLGRLEARLAAAAPPATAHPPKAAIRRRSLRVTFAHDERSLEMQVR